MNKKQLIIHILCVLTGILIGIGAMSSYHYFANVHQFNILEISENDIEDFESEKVWDKIITHYQNDIGIAVDSYSQIYTTYSVKKYMDDTLSSYYDKYGYDVVLKSGLESSHKLINVYSIEKCCEIIGETKINNRSLLESLNKIKISGGDGSNLNESQYYELAKNRYNLAKALLSQSFDSPDIYKNSEGNVNAWISNALYNSSYLRVYTAGLYYTINNLKIDINDSVGFITKDSIKIDNPDGEAYIVSFGNNIVIYDIATIITSELPLAERDEIRIYDTSYNGYVITGKFIPSAFYENRSEEWAKEQIRSFTLDMKSGKIEIA